MSGLASVLPIPAAAEKPRTRSKVENRYADEALLVKRVQARDELAFREIVERYQAKVYSIIFGILRNRNDAGHRPAGIRQSLLLYQQLRFS